ncbi:MAG: rRNA methyltransferase [Treponema sp.]|nr:rRNA methyltransferase [Treponema sp.]
MVQVQGEQLIPSNTRMYLFPPLTAEVRRTLEDLPRLIDQVFPLPRRFRVTLYRETAELSRLLTSSRGERSDSYLTRKGLLSAYLRYFLPWNSYRLCRLLPGLALDFAAGDAVLDLGAGPLTLVLALWIARPDIRQLPLEFRCLDRSAAALNAGKRLFQALAGASPWIIKPIHAPLGARIYGPKVRLVSALQVFNERFEKIPQADTRALQEAADKTSRLLSSLVAPDGSILVLEPGVPWSGEWLAALRSALLKQGKVPYAPCPHQGACPCPGGKAKWCHFSLDTEDAPVALHNLSAAAGLPKERAPLSFLLTGPRGAAQETLQGEENTLAVRILSDRFPLSYPSNRYGRYGCSERGLVLVIEGDLRKSGTSGELVLLKPGSPEKRDPKTGALMMDMLSLLKQGAYWA